MRQAASAAGVEISALAGVGVGAPGAVDASGGHARARREPARLGGRPFPVVAELGADLGVPVRIGNDVRVAVEAERVLGAGRTYRSFLGVWWGTGIGGALVLDGKLWLGRGSPASSGTSSWRWTAGAVPAAAAAASRPTPAVVRWSGARASSRSRSGRRSSSRSCEARSHPADERRVGDGARAGDAVADALFEEAVDALGAGVGSVQNLVDVDAVVVGGGLGTRLGEPYVAAHRRRPRTRTSSSPTVRRFVVLTELGDNGGGLGAALLVSG